jgi:hypothetical protein
MTMQVLQLMLNSQLKKSAFGRGAFWPAVGNRTHNRPICALPA